MSRLFTSSAYQGVIGLTVIAIVRIIFIATDAQLDHAAKEAATEKYTNAIAMLWLTAIAGKSAEDVAQKLKGATLPDASEPIATLSPVLPTATTPAKPITTKPLNVGYSPIFPKK